MRVFCWWQPNMLAIILASTLGSLQQQYNAFNTVFFTQYLSYHKLKVMITWVAAVRMLAVAIWCGVASCKLLLGRQMPPGGL
jgi:uncharacterized membrane protein